MKEVILIRHAKSDWGNAALPDHERPLNARGMRDAPAMAAWLAQQHAAPDVVICSTAVRARDTADQFIAAFGLDHEKVVRTKDVYHADVQDILDLIAWIPKDDDRCVLLVGHNPTFTYVLNALAEMDMDNMPTCSIAIIQFPDATSWKALGKGHLATFMTPKLASRPE